MNHKILVTEADISLATILVDYLRAQGYHATAHELDSDTQRRVLLGEYDLLLLSHNQTQLTIYEQLSRMRQAECGTPVVVLSDSGAKDDVLRAYECGCDDYIVKPFNIEILVCRLAAVLRRTNPALLESKETVFRFRGGTFDSVKQQLLPVGSEPIHLSARESELLLMLCRRMGTIVNRRLILRRLWHSDSPFAAKSLSVFVHRLRKMAEPIGVQIMPVRGKGYKLTEI
ncbi:MAG: response regulator transcription factor [Paludibacteraceae bacterium]|nr:response regulator transcription factor [Paludibacteraceae bacterium]